MSARLLDGRPVARAIRRETAAAATEFQAQMHRPASLVSVRIGEDEAAASYGKALARACDRVGLGFQEMVLRVEQAAMVPDTLRALNTDPGVDGVIIQQPLPSPLSVAVLGDVLDARKDVDGLTPRNAGLLALGRPALIPSTPLGGMELLRHYDISVAGLETVVVGRSPVVGRPLASLLVQEHATVTVCHTRTADLAAVTRRAQLLCVAAGRPGLIQREMVQSGAVVLDFGTNPVDGQIVGDVTPDVGEVASWLTPVPGGTGPVTTAALLRTTVEAARARFGLSLSAPPTNGTTPF